jgi:hypothetical protein
MLPFDDALSPGPRRVDDALVNVLGCTKVSGTFINKARSFSVTAYPIHFPAILQLGWSNRSATAVQVKWLIMYLMLYQRLTARDMSRHTVASSSVDKRLGFAVTLPFCD